MHIDTDTELIAKVGRIHTAMLRWRLVEDSSVAGMRGMHADTREVGGVRYSRVGGGPCVVERDRSLVAEESQSWLCLMYKVHGRKRWQGNGALCEAGPGDVVVWRSDAALRFEVLDEGSEDFVMLVPSCLFLSRLQARELPVLWHLDAKTPVGAVVRGLFAPLVEHLDRLHDPEAEYMFEAAIDLVARSLHFQRRAMASVECGEPATLFERIVRSIERRLDDAELSPQAIAAAHSISVRYLHRLFEKQGLTVWSWVRERRLLRCRSLLEQPASQQNITDLAMQWGFSDSAHFSRLFKERFGASPSQWRLQHARTVAPSHAAGEPVVEQGTSPQFVELARQERQRTFSQRALAGDAGTRAG